MYAMIDTDTGKPTLFMEDPNPISKIWMHVLTKEGIKAKYGIETQSITELQKILSEKKPSVIYLNSGINSDSSLPTLIPTFDWLSNFKVDKDTMHDILANSRAHKNSLEIEVIKESCIIASEAHISMMH